MKHMMRKPMLPLLLLAVMVFGTAFLSFFKADIAAGWEQVDRLYSDTQVTVELVPEAGWDEIQLKTHKDIMISGMPEVERTLTVMECYYVLRDGTPLTEADPELGLTVVDTDTIRGTNDLEWLTDYWDLEIEWLDGWGLESFRVENGKVPCLVRRELYGSVGGVVAASPTAWYGEINPQAPTFELVVAGVVSDAVGRIGERDLLVPEESFLGEPKLFYNSDLMYRCYYRAYAMELDPAYNREYDRVEKELEQKLYDLSAYSFATNAHALENAARPLVQKLQMQELLVTPLCVLLCLAAVVIAVLLGMSFELEVFLRLMWGEKRAKVFVTLSGAVLLWLVICVLVSVGAGFVMPVWAAKFSTVTAGLSMAGCAVPLGIRCGGNLIRSYQSREGE